MPAGESRSPGNDRPAGLSRPDPRGAPDFHRRRASALAEKARAHRPLLLHRVVRAGARVSDLAAATGLSPAELRSEWQAWAEQQRWLATQTSSPHAPGTFIGMSAPEYAGVAALFDGDESPP